MMAYNQYFPTNYQPYQPAQQAGGSIVWVQGEAAARSYMVGANQSVLLMDSDATCFYIKSADASGMPQPLRIFDYTERTVNTSPIAEKSQNQANINLEEYVTRSELEETLAKFAESLKPKKGKKDE